MDLDELRSIGRDAMENAVIANLKKKESAAEIERLTSELARVQELHTGLMKNADEKYDALVAELAAAKQWKYAVIDELIVSHTLTAEHETNPRKAIQDAISWNVYVALDPQVSSDAQKLIDSGKAKHYEECAAIAIECSYGSISARAICAALAEPKNGDKK